MEETTMSKAANMSDAIPPDATDILPPLEELSEEELFDINGGTARIIIHGATAVFGLPAPKNRPHDPTK